MSWCPGGMPGQRQRCLPLTAPTSAAPQAIVRLRGLLDRPLCGLQILLCGDLVQVGAGRLAALLLLSAACGCVWMRAAMPRCLPPCIHP